METALKVGIDNKNEIFESTLLKSNNLAAVIVILSTYTRN